MEHIYLVAAVVFAATVVQSVSGFGFALVAMSILSLIMPMKTATPLVLLCGMLITFLIFLRLIRHLDISKFIPLLAGALFGVPFGAYVLVNADETLVRRLLALLLFLYSVYSLTHTRSGRVISRNWGFLFGFLSGCFGSAFNYSGPPVIVYTSMQNWDKDDIVVTMQSFFFISGLAIVAVHALNGLITTQVLASWALLSPVLFLGVFAGSRLYEKIDQDLFRRILFLLLILLSLVIAVK